MASGASPLIRETIRLVGLAELVELLRRTKQWRAMSCSLILEHFCAQLRLAGELAGW